LFLLACCTFVVGCKPTPTAVPLTQEQIGELKTPLQLSDLEKRFGPARDATELESEALDRIIAMMPKQQQEDAQQDHRVGWGAKDGYVAGIVNKQGTVWVVTYSTGNSNRP
jgi:hypothetical protein